MAVGQQGAQQYTADLGPLPSYAQGCSRSAASSQPATVEDLSFVLPTGIRADVLTALAHPHHPRSDEAKPQNYLTPALAMGLRAVTNTNQYGDNKASTNGNIGRSFAATTPELALWEGLHAKPGTQYRRMYPKSVHQAVLQALFGTAAPKKLNTPVAARHARQGR